MDASTVTAAEVMIDAMNLTMADFEIPAELLSVDGGQNTWGHGWTRQSVDLPDGTTLVTYDDDEVDVVVLVRDGGARGPELARIRFSNPSERVLRATLSAIVAASLED